MAIDRIEDGNPRPVSRSGRFGNLRYHIKA